MLLWVAALTLLAPIAIYLIERARFCRFRQYANLPQLRSSLFWGHLKALDGVMSEGDRRRHIGMTQHFLHGRAIMANKTTMKQTRFFWK